SSIIDLEPIHRGAGTQRKQKRKNEDMRDVYGSGLVLAISSLSLCVSVAQFTAAAEPTYWQDIRPVFRKHCTVCHNEKNLKELDVSGGLALDTFVGVRRGRQTPIVTPGDGANSPLIRALRHADNTKRMPLDGEPLPDTIVALLKAWIDAGAKE